MQRTDGLPAGTFSSWCYDNDQARSEVIATLCRPDMCYEFDEWQAHVLSDGRLGIAHDSGCSCPSPFEEGGYEAFIFTPGEWTNADWNEVQGELITWANNSEVDLVDCLDFLRKLEPWFTENG